MITTPDIEMTPELFDGIVTILAEEIQDTFRNRFQVKTKVRNRGPWTAVLHITYREGGKRQHHEFSIRHAYSNANYGEHLVRIHLITNDFVPPALLRTSMPVYPFGDTLDLANPNWFREYASNFAIHACIVIRNKYFKKRVFKDL